MRALLALFLLAAGCQPKLEHHELPGSGIDLPVGLRTEKSLLDHRVGQLGLGGLYRGDMLASMIRWTPGERDGQALIGYVRTATHGQRGLLELALASTKADAEAADPGLKVATCLPPGAPSPTWPDASR